MFLIGFMAAGKSSVGRALAGETGRRFVDLDEEIARMSESGEPVAALVARDEAEFRRREAAALAGVIARGVAGAVIATGGGAAAFGDNLERMRAAGMVVALGVDVAVARARAAAGDDGARPLLARADELAAARASIYRRAHAVIDTSQRTLAEVVAEVAAAERAWRALPAASRTGIAVALGARTYPIVVAPALADLRAAIDHAVAGATQVALVTDANVAAAHGRAFADRGWLTVTIPPGEASKSLATYERLCAQLIAAGLDRASVIVALGGGVVGDLAGFVAATLFRGVPVVQIPTTIVAMTDAAIGGKTAVDLPAGKNLVGAFHQPRLVACGLDALATLPARERRAGFGELWKYALLDGAALWRLVDACAPWAAADHAATAPPPELHDVILRSIAYKAATVSRDELERTGHRALLNLGHTVGHAIESQTGMLHGEAVALGLVAAARVSHALGLAPATLEPQIAEAVRRTGLDADLDAYLTPTPTSIVDRLKVDKKRHGDGVRFIAVRDVGACEPVHISFAELGRILRPRVAP